MDPLWASFWYRNASEALEKHFFELLDGYIAAGSDPKYSDEGYESGGRKNAQMLQPETRNIRRDPLTPEANLSAP